MGANQMEVVSLSQSKVLWRMPCDTTGGLGFTPGGSPLHSTPPSPLGIRGGEERQALSLEGRTQKPHPSFCLHLTTQNIVTWLHPGTLSCFRYLKTGFLFIAEKWVLGNN